MRRGGLGGGGQKGVRLTLRKKRERQRRARHQRRGSGWTRRSAWARPCENKDNPKGQARSQAHPVAYVGRHSSMAFRGIRVTMTCWEITSGACRFDGRSLPLKSVSSSPNETANVNARKKRTQAQRLPSKRGQRASRTSIAPLVDLAEHLDVGGGRERACALRERPVEELPKRSHWVKSIDRRKAQRAVRNQRLRKRRTVHQTLQHRVHKARVAQV